MTRVETDPGSGFCGGVIRAIGTAEKYISKCGGHLYSLGDIVHNEEELQRLSGLGLQSVSLDSIDSLVPGPLLIRAHGEAPEVYSKLEDRGFSVIDCTCPVVLKLQKDIREAWTRVRPLRGRIIIFGKIGHPEVLGLVGQTGGEATVVEGVDGVQALVSSPEFNADAPVELFSQTTMSPEGYASVKSALSGLCHNLRIHETICSQVASRHKSLSEFAASHDVVVFVSGSSSSNGKVLSALCRQVNRKTYVVASPAELHPEWFEGAESVGVCGATSTPKWLLEDVASAIRKMTGGQ